jgi:hypothetical protein
VISALVRAKERRMGVRPPAPARETSL